MMTTGSDTPTLRGVPAEIVCEGQYTHHLQGITGNGVDTIYWSFTTVLARTCLLYTSRNGHPKWWPFCSLYGKSADNLDSSKPQYDLCCTQHLAFLLRKRLI